TEPEKPGTTELEKSETTEPKKAETTNSGNSGKKELENAEIMKTKKTGTTSSEGQDKTSQESSRVTMDSAQSQKELPKTGQRTPLEPYMGAALVMMSFGLLVLGKKRQQ
ncbi:LPXTG cell wall anchor domain-containing protein, partial [Bacillus sp. JJ1127]|uniref:LPXTG cell wall anchor domain-containing protein n=1 Tax=Bacillus sp. JJ1127 TaxID=3122952 RepID=UPI002FFD82FD